YFAALANRCGTNHFPALSVYDVFQNIAIRKLRRDDEYLNRLIHLKYLLDLFSSMSCYLDGPTDGEAHSNGRQGRLRERRFTSSMAKTRVFAISMSGPASGLISRVFSWSRKNMPRRLTLAGPKASCTTTIWPIHD